MKNVENIGENLSEYREGQGRNLLAKVKIV